MSANECTAMDRMKDRVRLRLHVFMIPIAFAVAAWSPPSYATKSAASDCRLAANETERAICANEELLAQDREMGNLYRMSLARYPSEGQRLRAEQRQWLVQRGRCGADESCLSTVYSARVQRLRSLIAYAPDASDWQAAKDLREEVKQQADSSPAWALESALEKYKVQTPTTSFGNVRSEDALAEGAMFPASPPANISGDEWKALKRGKFTAEGENGMGSYTLMDVDGDGRRDLVVDTYVGGTGLFDSFSAYRRTGDHFAGFGISTENGDEHFVYLTNGRGSNQYGEWIQLRGRTYLAYVDGTYGRDHVVLLRPFELNQQAIGFDVLYSYQWTLPRIQQGEGKSRVEMSDPLWEALSQPLQRVVDRGTATEQDSDAQVCPPPPGLQQEDADAFGRFGPGHYSYEIIADFPVQLGESCRPGRLVDWFGRYDKNKGLAAELWVLRSDDTGEDEFDVTAFRKTVSVNDPYLSDAPSQ